LSGFPEFQKNVPVINQLVLCYRWNRLESSCHWCQRSTSRTVKW